jgi:cyanophycin synthetase
LRMGRPGDLLLIFADALVRSWKQITKFKTSGEPDPRPDSRAAAAHAPAPSPIAAAESKGNGASERANHSLSAPAAVEKAPEFNLEGLIRDERGISVARESED